MSVFINSKLIKDGIVLWENDNPNDSFLSKVITVEDYDSYDYFEYVFNGNIAGQNYISFRALPQKIGASNMPFSYTLYSGSVIVRSRGIHRNGQNMISISDGEQNGAINNNLMVPQYIIGYKTNTFK